MKLADLIRKLKVERVIGGVNLEISGLTIDSNSVVKGSLFICLKGGLSDGHDYIRQVENYGGVAIIAEKQLDTNLTQIIVKDSRKAMTKVAQAFYFHPEKDMKIIAVVGTNGKTTTSHLIYNVIKGSGYNAGLIGTIGSYYRNKYIEPSLTTPDPIELYKTFKIMKDEGIDTVIMEASAHAIHFDKLYGLKFFAVVFTNFSEDHLDFFKDMQSYKRAKMKIFNENESKFIITNSDDKMGLEIKQQNPKAITYGIDNPSDVFAIDVKNSENRQTFVLNLFDCIYEINTKLLGKFNVYNILAATTVCALYGVPVDEIIEGIEEITGVDGRLQIIHDGKYLVYVDYAHTPDGLKKSLETLKGICEGRLINVFGCGGNRDKQKRAIMGKISGEIADFTVITSDNPRYEEPMEIIGNIEEGIKGQTNNYIIIQERQEAIKYALDYAKEKDIVLVAGKGCEKYQEILGIKTPYNDKDCIDEIIRSK